VILRPVHIVGSVRNAPSNYLRLGMIPTLMGFDPMVQIIHQDDVVDAICRALGRGTRGIFNLAGPPPIALSRLVRATGRPSVSIPYTFLRAGISRLWRLRATSFPAPELDHIRYVCMVDDARARSELGHAPKRGVDDVMRALGDVV
jgi:UDP-glucose 4-epimerase